jgi:hypothetical protein
VFTNVLVYLCFIYNASTKVLFVYILIACGLKNVCGIDKLNVGYVTICSAKRIKEFSSVAWPNLGGRGHYKIIS